MYEDVGAIIFNVV